MRLYSHYGTCSSAVHIILNEVGADFELVNFDFGEPNLPDGRKYTDINPKGVVPALELDNGEVVTETAVILQYIADLHPESDVAPANGTFERVRLQEWLSYLGEVHSAMGVFFAPELTGPMRDKAEVRLQVRLTFLDDHFADNRYLLGDKYSIADAYLFIILSWSEVLQKDISQYTNIAVFREGVAERASVQQALEVKS